MNRVVWDEKYEKQSNKDIPRIKKKGRELTLCLMWFFGSDVQHKQETLKYANTYLAFLSIRKLFFQKKQALTGNEATYLGV
jgi:hypothetical protein